MVEVANVKDTRSNQNSEILTLGCLCSVYRYSYNTSNSKVTGHSTNSKIASHPSHSKVMGHIEFPEHLDVSPYMSAVEVPEIQPNGSGKPTKSTDIAVNCKRDIFFSDESNERNSDEFKSKSCGTKKFIHCDDAVIAHRATASSAEGNVLSDNYFSDNNSSGNHFSDNYSSDNNFSQTAESGLVGAGVDFEESGSRASVNGLPISADCLENFDVNAGAGDCENVEEASTESCASCVEVEEAIVEQTVDPAAMLYTLYAVLVHDGSSTKCGHYYCYVRALNGTSWFCLNDTVVSGFHLNFI